MSEQSYQPPTPDQRLDLPRIPGKRITKDKNTELVWALLPSNLYHKEM